ncbi:TfoX/Sxy family protein [Chitinophaga japonensis]|uniref:TfoX-like protein n=1 Tax=Chitinophaga japonensis TaxID=104662 RepID=A0A562SRY3_CHIJA|nr:TfoX/Sxy family protein [Chitinophaga japonensis]TWI84001.1 TfoX-like protein [Chitinophaga japonensis]
MAFNGQLADRVRELIAAATDKSIAEKKMFGGLCFMVDDKMCVGVREEYIMVRLAPAFFEEALEKEGCKPMVMGDRVMKGFLYVDDSVLATKKQLQYWVQKALDYNPLAKASKKK